MAKKKVEKEMAKNETEVKDVKVEAKENNKFPHTHIIITIIAVLALVFSIIDFIRIRNISNMLKQPSYRIYIGLTDSNKNYQTIDTDAAREIIKTVCVSKGVAYTIYDAEGGHKDREDVLHLEKTLILEMGNINQKDLMSILDDIGIRLNSQSMYVTRNYQNSFYYYPDNS